MKKIILGTRGSELALVQTRETATRLGKAQPDLEIEERIIKTTGDKRLDVSLSAPGSLEKGLFTKELEDALLLPSRAVPALHRREQLAQHALLVGRPRRAVLDVPLGAEGPREHVVVHLEEPGVGADLRLVRLHGRPLGGDVQLHEHQLRVSS
jgi:hypothetical protein